MTTSAKRLTPSGWQNANLVVLPVNEVEPPAQVIANYVRNPSMETNQTGWTAVGTSISGGRTTTWAHDGTCSVSLSHDSFTSTTVGGFTYTLAPGGLEGGKTYTFSAWFWTQYTKSMRIGAGWRDSSNAAIGSTVWGTGKAATVNNWTRYNSTFTAPENATGVNFYLWLASGMFQFETAYIDGVMIQEGSILNSYVDGDTPGYVWSGTPHASATVQSV